jgi:hypothetical protein
VAADGQHLGAGEQAQQRLERRQALRALGRVRRRVGVRLGKEGDFYTQSNAGKMAFTLSMHTGTLAKRLVAALPVGRAGLFNPWRERCSFDTDINGPDHKLARLAEHLDCEPRYIVCGEAIGHLGCRHSGIAFTSERLLLKGSIPRISRIDGRLTKGELPFSEPSATVVWRTLERLGIAEKVVLWNALQLHPYIAGNIRSNRTPTSSELELGVPAIRILLSAFPRATVIPVGKSAQRTLQAMGVNTTSAVRHPAYGGATAFLEGVTAIVGSSS